MYQPLVDQWVVCNNAGDEPVLIDWSGQPMTKPNDLNEPQPAYGQLPANADFNLQGSFAALVRAANKARQLAEQTGTDLIVMRDGQVTRVGPQKKRQHEPA